MKKHHRFLLLLLTGQVLLLLDTACIAEQDRDPSNLLKEGRALLERNSGDSVGATRNGLETGIELLNHALELGLEEPALPTELSLVPMVTSRLSMQRPDSADQQKAREQQKNCWQHLLELLPDDTEVLYENVSYLEEENEQIAMLERILAIDSEHLQAMSISVDFLSGNGQVEQGLDYMRSALLKATGRQETLFFGRRLSNMLASLGRQMKRKRWT